MNRIVDGLNALGHLHDARINDLRWSEAGRVLTVRVDDLNENFRGRPEYPGVAPGVLVLPRLIPPPPK